MGSAENITGNGGLGTSTFIARRQDALEFTAEVTLEFNPNLGDTSVEGEEAGMTLFIQRTQHFDLGVMTTRTMGDNNGSGDGRLQRVILLRTIDANSSADGLSDPLSQPGTIPLPDDIGPLRLKVQALNASTYAFSYADRNSENIAHDNWTIVGYGEASEVSGGFTGVSQAHLKFKAILLSVLYRRLSGCMRQGTATTQLHQHTLVLLITCLSKAFINVY